MRQYSQRNSSRFFGAPVTKWLMIIIFAVFLIDIAGAGAVGRLKPFFALGFGAFYEVWRMLAYSLVDFNVISWLFSLMILYSFGRLVEQSIGSRRFAVFVGYCILAGALVFMLMRFLNPGVSPLTGASSMTIGLVVAAGLLYPEQQVQMMLPPMPVKLKNLALFLVGFVVIMAIAQRIDPAVSLAHLSGVAVAYFCMRNVSLLDIGKPSSGNKRPSKKRSPRKRPAPYHKPAKKKAGMKPRTLLKMSVSKREEEVNRILDKVSSEGIGNLTDEEKEILKFAANND